MTIDKIIKNLKIDTSDYEMYGSDKAKIKLDALYKRTGNEDGKLVLVTAMTPTSFGEGKTTVSIGLADSLSKLKKKSILALREPSLGPVFGLKGGAVGGGKSILIPENDINLHFTGDFHAVTTANNLLCAIIDAHIYHGNELDIQKVVFKRTLDINDRSLRKINTSARKEKFQITAASEIMAIVSLANSIEDLRVRLGNILVGYNSVDYPIFASHLGCIDALLIVLKDALKPNLVQTNNGTPALVHMGPFANVAHGCNSVVATKLALKLGEYVVTEAGFGSDLGAEKFFNIKMPYLEKTVDMVVIVLTIRALKSHGGVSDENIEYSNPEAVKYGLPNLEKHVENIMQTNSNFILALNHFSTDHQSEIDTVLRWAKARNLPISIVKSFEQGATGAIDLAKRIIKECRTVKNYTPIYNKNDSIAQKIVAIAGKIYGAGNVVLSDKALAQTKQYEAFGWGVFPICMAKTPLSLSGDATLKGRPLNFDLLIEEIEPSLGAGFLVARTKGIVTMPGLNKYPRAYQMKIDANGEIVTLG